jgi:glycogen operon protein
VFRRTRFFEGRGEQLPDVWWMRPDGRRMTRRDWDNADARAIGVFLNGDEVGIETQRGEEVHDDSFLVLFNAHYEDITFRLPARRFGARWALELATGRCDCDPDQCVAGVEVVVESRSVAVFRRV